MKTKPTLKTLMAILMFSVGVSVQAQEKEYSLSISADKMNILYEGVDNPITIVVYDVPAEEYKVSITNGTIREAEKKGHFIVNCQAGISKAVISVSANINGKTVLIGTSEFRVIRVPDPEAQICGVQSGKVSKDELFKSAVIPIMKDFNFPLYFKITSFKVNVIDNNGDLRVIHCDGNMLNDKAKSIISELEKVPKVFIEDIKAIQLDSHNKPVGDERTLKSISVTIL